MSQTDDDDVKEKQDPPAPLGVADWMVTYGDMMTLLLCFFVLLFIFSKSDVEKYRSAIGSIQEAFGVQDSRPESPFHAYSPTPDTGSDADQDQREAIKEIISQAESDLFNTLQKSVEDLVVNEPDLKHAIRIETEETGVKLSLRNDQLFMPHTAMLQPDAVKNLRPVIDAAQKHSFNIMIRNNSTKSDLDTQYFPSVWELSGARAGSALRVLLETGDIASNRLKAVAYGDSAPLFPENDPANAAANNRTEFLFYFPGKEVW